MGTTNLGKVGVINRKAWSAAVANYERLDTVSYQGSTYQVILENGYVPAGTLPTNTTYYELNAAKGDPGATGSKGWQPVYANVVDGLRVVQKLVDYTGGEGTKPTENINSYIGASGYTTILANAVNVKGNDGSIDTTAVANRWQVRGAGYAVNELATYIIDGIEYQFRSIVANNVAIPNIDSTGSWTRTTETASPQVWDATNGYALGAYCWVTVSGVQTAFRSKVASNLNHDPATDTNQTYWTKLGKYWGFYQAGTYGLNDVVISSADGNRLYVSNKASNVATLADYGGTGSWVLIGDVGTAKNVSFDNPITLSPNLYIPANILVGSVMNSSYTIGTNTNVEVTRVDVTGINEIEVTWKDGAADRFARWEKLDKNILTGGGFIITGRYFKGTKPAGAYNLAIGTKKLDTTEPIAPTEMIIRSTAIISPPQRVNKILGKEIVAAKLADELMTLENPSATYPNLRETGVVVEGKSISISTSGTPYAISDSTEAAYIRSPVDIAPISISWEGGADFRPGRWEDANNNLIIGFTISNRGDVVTPPAGTVNMALSIKRTNATETAYPVMVIRKVDSRRVLKLGGREIGLPSSAGSDKSVLNGYLDNTSVTIGGIPARIITPDLYAYSGVQSSFLLYAHGNSGNITSVNISANFFAFCKANNIVIGIINLQDSVSQGYGNIQAVNRLQALAEYVKRYYNVNDEIIGCSGSMGGLPMGILASSGAYNFKFCFFSGPTPDLSSRFAAGTTAFKAEIRTAFGMPSNGSDDANIDNYILGHNWFKMNTIDVGGVVTKFGMPRSYFIWGDGDTSFTNDFGGYTKTNELVARIKRAGTFAKVSYIVGGAHNGSANYDLFVSSGDFAKELNL